MKRYYNHLWNLLERKSTLETDSHGERRRKVTLVVIAILSCLCGVVSALNSWRASGLDIYVLIPSTFTFFVGTALVLFFVTKRFYLLLFPFLFMILFIPVLFQASVGGFSAPGSINIIFWSLLAPFGSLMFQDVRKAMWWFLAYLSLVLLSLISDNTFAQYSSPTTHSDLMISHGINIIWLSITIFFTMLYFVNAFQKAQTRAENLVIKLTTTNNELEKTLFELKQTQSELVQSEKMAALGKLAAGLAHEINNPIGALKSTAGTSTRCVDKIEQFLSEREKSSDVKNDATLQNFFHILKDNSQVVATVSDRVANTVNSFIHFARLDKAGFDKVDIHKGIDDTLTLIQHEIKAGTSIKKEYGDIPDIRCFPGELNQVFMNLLTNAAHAIKEKGIITIHTFTENEKVYIEIQDTGIGISHDRFEGLFDPVFSKDGSRVKARLGLFTSYNIVQKHHGDLKVESEVNQGSTFTVILPLDLEKNMENT